MASNTQSQPLDLSTDPQKKTGSPSFGPDLSQSKRSGGVSRFLTPLLLLVALSAGIIYAFPKFKETFFSQKSAVQNYVTKPAVKGPFQIKVVAKGTVDSSRNASLVSNVEGSTTIISIIPAGSLVVDPLISKVTGEVITVKNVTSGTAVVVVAEKIQKVDDEGNPLKDQNGKIVEEINHVEHTYNMTELSAIVVEPRKTVSIISPTGEVDENGQLVRVDKTVPGTMVKAGDILIGDLVCELDAAPLIDEEKQQQIAVEQASADLEKAVKNAEIQRLQNDTDMSDAELQKTLAELDLMKYIGSISDLRSYLGAEINDKEWESVKSSLDQIEQDKREKTREDDFPGSAELTTDTEDRDEPKPGEFKQEVDRIEGEIKQSAAELKQAIAKLEYTERLAKKGYKTPEEVNTEKLTVSQKELSLKVKQTELNVLTKFTLRRNLTEFLANLKETERHVGRVKLAGDAALAQIRAEVTAAELADSVQRTKLDELRRQIRACKLIAPQSGRVVYANENSRRGSEPVVIEEGASVRERQKLINLPDLTAMKVDARIHESKISNVVAGLPVQIRVDAIPNHVYAGKLDAVSAVPLPGSWPNTDLKEYEATVRITDTGEELKELKPGMTANIDIIVENSNEDLLQIPVQATVRIGKEYYVWVLNSAGQPEKRQPRLGRSNDVDFVVEEGITEGELVVMNPMTQFADELKEMREKADNADLKNQPKVENPGPQNLQNPSPGAGPEGAVGPVTGGPRGGGDPSAFFKRLDKDEDGKLSDAEIPEQMKERFANADSDKDGFISLAEFQAVPRPQGGGPGGGGRPGGPGGGGRPDGDTPGSGGRPAGGGGGAANE